MWGRKLADATMFDCMPFGNCRQLNGTLRELAASAASGTTLEADLSDERRLSIESLWFQQSYCVVLAFQVGSP